MKRVPSLLTATALLLSIFTKIHQSEAQTYQGRELVKAEMVADTSDVVAGKPFTVGVLLRMAPGWHTYWKFSGDAGLPTEIKWNLPPGWKAGAIQWPIPRKLVEPGDILTYGYNDDVLLMQQITPADKIDNRFLKLTADVNWLVCEKLCIPGSATLSIEFPREKSDLATFERYRKRLPSDLPRDVSVRQELRGANEALISLKGRALSGSASADFFPLPEDKTVVGHPKAEIRGDQIDVLVPLESRPPKEVRGLLVLGDRGFYVGGQPTVSATQASAVAALRGVWTFLLFGFIGGFILNLMPCVLPVISLKIFGFIQQAGQDRRKIFRSGVAFVAGIFLWFVGLALLLIALKSAGHEVTWAAQFTNPYFILALSVIVLVFALNLFGVFEINVPQPIMRFAGSTTTQGEAGSFFQGLFATVLATPCTAPFLGTALGFAFTQSALVILSMFVSIAAGMSAPYLVLSAAPAWLRFLPKPGRWMERVKQLMGFLLLATLLFLLYVLGAQRGYEALTWASAFLLVVAIACWLKGSFIVPTASRGTKAVVAVLMLALLLLGGSYFIGGKFSGSKMDIVQTAGDWQPFTPERLKSELDAGRSVFIDFTAAWCITCKFNEKAVLESADVRDAFQRHGTVKLRADWTNGDPVITKLLQQFGRPGVPLYVLYSGDAGEPFVFPELLTKSMVLDKLQTVRSRIAFQ